MEEYRNPFQLPNMKCTNEHDANITPYFHSLVGTDRIISASLGPKCPAHCEEKDNDPWLAWATYREAYATADGEDEEKAEAARELFMAKMLATVTATNPPDAKPDYGIWMQTESTGRKTNTWYDIEVERRILAIHWVLASLVAWLAVIATGITLLGGWW